jgi:glycosyltransferase involved in cell wall biosynthesis
MRIGLVIYGSLETVSGGYLYDRRLVDFLRKQGDQVEIVSIPWRNYANHLIQNLSAHIHNEILSKRVDIWLQDELNHPSLVWMNAGLKFETGVPFIGIVHHLRSSEEHRPLAKWLYRRIERAYLRSLHGFIYNSETTRTSVIQLSQLEHPGVVAYPAGDRFAPAARMQDVELRCQNKGPLRILYTGSIIQRKGLLNLLHALARLDADTWRLVVVGREDVEVEYTNVVRSFIQANGMVDRVCMLGNASNEQLRAELANAHVLAMISTYEGFGIVYLEGMSFGLPALASTAGAAGELIKNGQSGWLLAPHDVDAIADKLQGYIENRDLLFAHSLKSLARFSHFPTWEQTGGRIRRFLVEMT